MNAWTKLHGSWDISVWTEVGDQKTDNANPEATSLVWQNCKQAITLQDIEVHGSLWTEMVYLQSKWLASTRKQLDHHMCLQMLQKHC